MWWRKQQDGVASPVANQTEIVEHIPAQYRRVARLGISENAQCPGKCLRALFRFESQSRGNLNMSGLSSDPAGGLLSNCSWVCPHLLQTTGIQKGGIGP